MVEVLARVLVAHPLHIFAVALLHFGLWAGIGMTAMRGSPTGNVMWVPALLWLAYACWEWLVLVKSPEADIRVDLLLIWPLVGLATLWGWLRTLWGWHAATKGR